MRFISEEQLGRVTNDRSLPLTRLLLGLGGLCGGLWLAYHSLLWVIVAGVAMIAVIGRTLQTKKAAFNGWKTIEAQWALRWIVDLAIAYGLIQLTLETEKLTPVIVLIVVAVCAVVSCVNNNKTDMESVEGSSADDEQGDSPDSTPEPPANPIGGWGYQGGPHPPTLRFGDDDIPPPTKS